ncbi:MAG: molybdenum cofactor biosynthesis protein MoaE [Sphingomonadaceae bacterium]|nr:molybdenum cofactor biosynthesis protein MoaE [Sphingomonadaceae bacterium]
MIHVRVGETDFDPGAEMAALGSAGAIATFIGQVRGDDGLVALTLEHYPAMTQAALRALAEEAAARWPLSGVRIVHRVGRLVPGERIVFVGTAAEHRAAALDACAFLIDALKTRAPFWKVEESAGGDRSWVEARDADDAAAARWTNLS